MLCFRMFTIQFDIFLFQVQSHEVVGFWCGRACREISAILARQSEASSVGSESIATPPSIGTVKRIKYEQLLHPNITLNNIKLWEHNEHYITRRYVIEIQFVCKSRFYIHMSLQRVTKQIGNKTAFRQKRILICYCNLFTVSHILTKPQYSKSIKKYFETSKNVRLKLFVKQNLIVCTLPV